MSDELYRLSAVETCERLRAGDISPLELVEVAAARIAAIDDQLNALPTLCLERAREHACAIMDGQRPRGLLGGLPIAVKDLNDVAGVRTTYGSPIYADHVPERSDLMVEQLEAQGAIVIGKSNTPEFGAGASTFNEVFGRTRNPWNTGRTVGGSSGGSAAALAAGQVWLATGSDLGGSLRIPASFNSVVGLRPGPGRVAHGPSKLPWDTLGVEGPMARSVADCALLLDAMAGQHPEDPLSLPAPQRSFLDAVRDAQAPRRIGFSPDLGGIVPVDAEVVRICEQAAHRFVELDTVVDDGCPDFDQGIAIFQTLRAALYAANHQDHLVHHREQLKPEVIWNIEQGLGLSVAELARAERARSRLFQRMTTFFRSHDLLLCPTVLVPPFDVGLRYLEEVNGQRSDNYVHWLALTFVISLTGCPAISVPAGLTVDGLPIGLQIVGPPHGEDRVLAAAALLEEIQGGPATPIDPRATHG